jgi:Spy/CpxP family protein refolding chaperone
MKTFLRPILTAAALCVAATAPGRAQTLPPPPPAPASMPPASRAEMLRTRLNLTESQFQQVSQIIDGARAQAKALRTESWAKFREVKRTARANIRAVLTPEQQKLFDATRPPPDAHRE